ncbi:MAG TPA: hypothetical protein VGO24_06760 [Solirubrobacterales bacterium]|jgi:hypothetical protein|nr:hypothetical protein [Solirubrobacterales bacterium]
MKPAWRLLLLVLLAVGSASPVAVAAEPEAETNECANLASCRAITNAPWVAVPAAQDGLNEQNEGISQPGTANWRMECGNSEVPAGRDYLSASVGLLTVGALVPPFDIGITGSSSANFFAISQGKAPASFKPLVGCIPKAPSASSAASGDQLAGAKVRQRTITRTLHAGQRRSFVHHCAKGEKLVGSAHGIGFYRPDPPSQKELKALEADRSERGGHVVVHVRTGAFEGERVVLQIHAFCRGG